MNTVIPREIRVFLSSTFRDMDAERDYLLTRVFPEIRRLCYERMVTFSEIDLRWGITEQAAKNGRTVQICLEEIERCRQLGIPPFFIGFLGERYGWVPQPNDLSEYWQNSPDQQYAEIIHQALTAGISVTELEIRFAFLEPPREFSLTSAEHGLSRVQMYLRDPALTVKLQQQAEDKNSWFDQLPDGTPDTVSAQKQQSLKQRLRSDFSGMIALDHYDSVEAFGESVSRYLREAIDTLYPAESVPDSWQQKIREHSLYAAVRRRGYIPMDDFRQQLVRQLNRTAGYIEPAPILISAPSGMGKSAFMADLETDLRTRNRPYEWPEEDVFKNESIEDILNKDQNYRVFSHYTGADGDQSLENFRSRLFHFLAFAGDNDTLSPDDAEAWEQLDKRLQRFTREHSVTLVLLLDAVNQLMPAENSLRRLYQRVWPRRVLLAITGTPEASELINQLNQEPEVSRWQLSELPTLTEDQRRALCSARLSSVSKTLSEPLTQRLITADACRNPLFLHLILEELCLHARHEALPSLLEDLLACQTPGALFLRVLQAADHDYVLPELATRTACCIAASRRGLTHSELAGALAKYPEIRVADQQLLPLLARLAPYCINSEGRLRLLHSAFEEAMQHSATMESCRESLIKHFTDLNDFSLAERTWQWLALDEAEAAIRELSLAENVVSLYRTDARLLHQLWQAAGIYQVNPLALGRKLNQPFSWKPFSEKLSTEDTVTALNIFTWLRQTGATTAASDWAEVIRPLIDAQETPDSSKAAFYNTLSVLQTNLGQEQQADQAIDMAIDHGFGLMDPGMMAGMMANKASVLNKSGNPHHALKLFENARLMAAIPPGNPVVEASIIMQMAQIKSELGMANSTETEQQINHSINIIRQLPPYDKQQKHLCELYQELASVFMEREDFSTAAETYLQAIAAGNHLYQPDEGPMPGLLDIYQWCLQRL
ncbi:DUF4062 domain-containing protein [Tatumella citrea]|uniref:DUF4062 domain-containing protein n=1 Tax=Tatumella citrea TaxID=53336 RepID=A0A1Y0L4F6_TATCI|nr:DUF4062 domain-containing protein [Tatumella citrea]ARU92630.1 hypothetical protein A7K98_01775 [Tatumella citrea]ARU96666.1 hypothetical protein A7K99_01775 [Tatumella citrea]